MKFVALFARQAGRKGMQQGKVLQMMPESVQKENLKPGDVVSMVPVDVLPFGMEFRQQIESAGVTAGTTTTATVSVTWGPDSDTDPPDSDF